MDPRWISRSDTSILSRRERVGASFGGVSLALFGMLGWLAYAWAAFARADGFHLNPLFLLLLLAAAVGPVLSPLWGSCAVFLVIPFFGNFPGGRFMELLNLPLAACVLGLTVRALKRRLAPPRDGLWFAALLYVCSAALALIPSLEKVAMRFAQINSWPEAIVEALTARETDPLYAVSSLVLVALAAAWAYTLCWVAPGEEFAHRALRFAAAGFVLTVVLGILDLHRVISLSSLLHRIDARSLAFEGFQSVFWNPGWFAWYFVMAFGLVLGLLWAEARAGRLFFGAILVISYFYSFANPQRGGFLALHAALVAALAFLLASRHWEKRTVFAAAAVFLAFVGLAILALRVLPQSSWRGMALTRLTRGPQTDIVRRNLAVVASRMWEDRPVFGIGEGAFRWRYGEYVPRGSELDTGFSADAHNTWLNILATRGILGLLAYLALLAALGRRAFHAVRQAGPKRGIGLALTFSLTAFLLYSFVQYMFYLQSIQVLFWGMVAIASIVTRQVVEDAARAEEKRKERIRGRPARWVAALAGLAAVGLQVGWSRPQLRRMADQLSIEPQGFYPIDKWGPEAIPMRWSSRKGTLCFYPTAPVVTVPLFVAEPGVTKRPMTVSLGVNGRLVDRFEIRSNASVGRSFYLLEAMSAPHGTGPIPFGQCVASASPLRLSVEVNRTWSPFSQGFGDDTRHLGVAVLAPTYAPPRPAMELGLSAAEAAEDRLIRWTGPRASLGVELPGEAASVSVPLRAANPDVERNPVQVRAYWNGEPRASGSLANHDWHDLRIDVSDPNRWGVLTLQLDRVWQPKASGVGADTRSLGVQMGAPRIEGRGVHP